ncbi:MAG: hypothetical protein WBM00_02750 [Solirubrobacterales bacterium]
MPDLPLSDALKRLAADAATRFTTLVASGDQIPFDVAAQAGPDALFHSYQPLTGHYVRAREAELRTLPTFAEACEAIEAAGVAPLYLEQRAEPVPVEPAEQAARMLTVFLASLWDGCTEFSLDRTRLDRALAVLDAEVRSPDEADVLLAPIVGLQMPLARLQLPSSVAIVRAGTIDAPVEAMSSEGMGRAAWEPQFFAVAELGEDSDSADAAIRQLQELISVMRLFKAGAVGLGPYAFAPTGEGQWRRLTTGAAPTRPGGYRLSKEEATELAELATSLEALPDPRGGLAWAVNRFELGCERGSALEGLSDHLLCLRALLEGEGPVGASLPMRAAALIAGESCDRTAAQERIERALDLEHRLMTGRPVDGSAALAMWLEESVRGMVRDAALGDLGTDLGVAADETLIANGLEAGDAAIVGTASEWEIPETGEVEVTVADENYEHETQETRILEPIPDEGEIRITATNWLDEVEAGRHTLEWPAGDGEVERRERFDALREEAAAPRVRIDTPRVRHLFPVPEDADWEVRELKYDHYNRRAS